MAKWKSKSIRKEVKRPDGSTEITGETAWIPLDDAAKADKARVQKAIDLGAYVPSSPDEAEKCAERLLATQRKDLQRKGLVPRDIAVTNK